MNEHNFENFFGEVTTWAKGKLWKSGFANGCWI